MSISRARTNSPVFPQVFTDGLRRNRIGYEKKLVNIAAADFGHLSRGIPSESYSWVSEFLKAVDDSPARFSVYRWASSSILYRDFSTAKEASAVALPIIRCRNGQRGALRQIELLFTRSQCVSGRFGTAQVGIGAVRASTVCSEFPHKSYSSYPLAVSNSVVYKRSDERQPCTGGKNRLYPQVEVCIGALVSLGLFLNLVFGHENPLLRILPAFLLLPLCGLLIAYGTYQLLGVESQCFDLGNQILQLTEVITHIFEQASC